MRITKEDNILKKTVYVRRVQC